MKWKRILMVGAALSAGLISSAMAFVTYFMHSVYEKEEEPVAQDIVPINVRQHFSELYPEARDPFWEFEEGTFEAEFRHTNGVETEVVFQPDGTLDRIVTAMPITELPQQAMAYLQSQRAYDIIEPEKIIRGQSVQYEAKLANQLMEWNCVFDAQGNLLFKKRDGPILE